MSFSYRPAVLDKTSLLIGIAGPTGSGKTYSALRLATGLVAGGGKIGFVDTEAGRGLHYARFFDFNHGILKPPFTPEAYTEAVETYEKAGFAAIIVDSMTHEYAGEGGLQEHADRLEASGVKSPGNWNEPKTTHKRMLNRFLQCRAHLIFCFRAEEKIKIERVNGKTVIVPVGFKPITEKNFFFDMTASFMMLDSAPGVPIPIKLQDQHKDAFPDGQVVTEKSGNILAAWANSGAAKTEATPKVETAAKKRSLTLIDASGVIQERASAKDWLDALRVEIDRLPSESDALRKCWDANIDVFYKIESAARTRNDESMIAAVNDLGKYAIGRIGTTEDA